MSSPPVIMKSDPLMWSLPSTYDFHGPGVARLPRSLISAISSSLREDGSIISPLRQRRDALARDDLRQLHRGLIERIDAQQMRGENRLQHHVHHQRAEARLVKAREIEGAHG